MDFSLGLIAYMGFSYARYVLRMWPWKPVTVSAGGSDPWNIDTRVLRTWTVDVIFQTAAQVLRRQDVVNTADQRLTALVMGHTREACPRP